MFEEYDTKPAQHPVRSLLKLLEYIKKYLPQIILALLFAMAGTVSAIWGPDLVSDMTDEITLGLSGTMNIDTVNHLGWLLVLIYGGSVVLTYGQNWIMATVTQKISKTLRTDIDTKLSRLPFRYFDHTTFGDVISRVTNDVDTISMSLSESFLNMLTSIIKFFGVLVMMLVTSPILASIAIVTSVVSFGFMALTMKVSQKYFFARQERLGTLNGYIEEQYSGCEVVKAFGSEDRVIRHFRDLNTGLYKYVWKAEFYSSISFPITAFLGNVSYVAVCVIGGIMAVRGSITFGVIVAFTLYVRTFSEPIEMLSQVAMTLQSTAAASERVFDFLAEEEMEDETDKPALLSDVRGAVEFRHIKFGYEPDKTIIHDFSAIAKPGQKIAIVGPTGAGKTTLVNLLMRFYDQDSGSILIDGVDTASVPRENVRQQFCMVLQDTWLFEGTIRDNLVYSTKGVTDEMLEEAVRAVGIDYYIHALPKGFDTILTDRASLSAGQKQQLTIARAIISNAPILILDEATSSVDTRTELVIQEAMDRLTVGRTSFVIAHRLSTIKNADLILCINHGDIVEQGTHAELLEKGGFYADLYMSQFAHME